MKSFKEIIYEVFEPFTVITLISIFIIGIIVFIIVGDSFLLALKDSFLITILVALFVIFGAYVKHFEK